MIYYEEKRKILIIPTGFGILAESGDCKDAIEEAFNSGWTAGYNSGVTQDCGDAIENAYNSGYTDGLADCSGTSCNLADGELNMGADWSGSEVITPAQGYDGFNSVEVNDTGYGQAKYDEGYEAGLADCSGGTCNLQSGNMPLGREWDGDDTIYPSQGYDGFDSVRIYDDGYGDLKYDSGYTQGFNDGQGGTVALQDKSVQQNTNLVTYYPDEGYNGIRSIYVDATGVYSNGHTDGQNYARSLMSSSAFTDNGTYTNPNGWSSVTVNVPQQGSCNLQDGQFVLDGQFDGNSGTIYPTAGYDGFDSFVITDGGYGQSKFDEGYAAGFQSGGARNLNFIIKTATYQGWPNQIREITLNGEPYNCRADISEIGAIKIYGETTESAITSLSFEIYTVYVELQSGVTINGAAFSAENITIESLSPDDFVSWHRCTIEFDDIPMYEIESSAVSSAYQNGYLSGHTDGYAEGLIACSGDCSEAIEEATAEALSSGWTAGYNSGFTYGRASFPYRQGYYEAGEESVIKSFLAGNDLGVYYDGHYTYDNYGLVVAYYYTPSGQPCVITGYNNDCDIRWNDVFNSMSVDGGPWENPTLYYYLSEGWHQIRFKVKDRRLPYAFNHNFSTSPVEDPLGNMVSPYMDALKAVSIPEGYTGGTSGVTSFIGTFDMNTGIRILSCTIGNSDIGNANIISGATNLNIIISHYQGNDNVNIRSDVQNGILFYPAGKLSTHSSTLSGWTKMELF